MTRDHAAELLEAMARRRVLVVGDAMLDEYIWGVAERISPEAPVLVVRSERVTHVPGGAANVINCLRALNAGAGLAAAVGDDHAGRQLRDQLAAAGVEPLLLVTDPSRPTTLKTRVVAHSQQVVRIDKELRGALPEELVLRLDREAGEALATCDGLLLSDYDKGVLTPDSIPPLLTAARRQAVPVAVNAKPHHARCYQEVDLVTVNRVEAEAVCGFRPESVAEAGRAADYLAAELRCRNLLITLGPDGAVLRDPAGALHHVEAVPVEVYDTAGAGDTTIATAHLALCAGATPLEAAELAMWAAAVVVRKVGVQTATPEEILAVTH